MSPQKTSSEPVGLLTCSINNQRLAYASDVSPLSVNDFERCDRQLHHGSTTTTCSSGSVLSSESWAVGSGGGASCSAASSSGIATMSSDDPNPSTSDHSAPNDGASSSSATVTEAILIPSTSKECGDGRTVDAMGESPCALASGQSLSSISCVSTKPSDVICNPWRNLVSQNRRRYKKDKFDLDLTYITDRIIAMGFPALDQEKIYRNSMEATVNFLERYHADHYMVFNLRGHHVYDPSYFHHRVMVFEMNDHHPPRLELMAPFCRAVHNYLAADDRNVVAVHCKAGKGRTGVMICAYLVYINFYLSPRQNMDYYSIVRTVNNKGVTIPSQRRYVYYFSHLRKRNLNYMPLRCELIGVYFEKPPRLNGLLFDGAFRLRVANGDVDVFIPGPLCLSGKRFDDEQEMWERFPYAVGEDQHDPCNPQPDKDCISRRCYGWTVPSNKRVFIEGDVRVDLYAKKSVKGFKWILKEREKLGHVWLNTMFICPQFCGGAYVHGDEAYPYPKGGTTIVNHWPPVTEKSSPAPPSPPSDGEKTNGALENVLDAQHSHANTQQRRSKSKKSTKSKSSHKRRLGISVNELSEKHQSLIGAVQHIFGEQRGECDDELLPDCDIEHPPGLDAHCPKRCLPLIYPAERGRKPPREGIKAMLRDAHLNELIADHYNQRRLSIRVGDLMPKAPLGRPECGGPNCLMRRVDEHVLVFNVLEIDRAFKNEKFDVGTKVYVVVRCVDADDPIETQLAEKCIQEIHAAQAKLDAAKNEEMRRKSGMVRGCDNASDSTSSQSSSSLPGDVLNDQPWRDDPRLDDPSLRRYFFKQRRDSLSRYPPADYRCPLRKQSPPSAPTLERSTTEENEQHGRSADSLAVGNASCPTKKLSHENLGLDNASEEYRATQDGTWLEESSESED
uniref:Phosphatidylinositol-3,4,5-trisphosphate 3-phosphatase and dual-specificity protein phosphatase PTEN n=1 Tax=Ascaris suum TaxID=6253 RepID=F1KUY1_ASCSU